MNEFFINNYRVDMQRSQIIDKDDIRAVEPRVLQVLYLLVKKQGEVVTHQEILDEVWPDVVVAPNAIQRCIVQLRKALNDDAKNQSVIITHPKKGYSLAGDVSFPDNQTQQSSAKSSPMLFTVLLLTFVGALLTWLLSTEKQENLTFTNATPITATDNKEFYPSYSPDGRYLAFNRYLGGCQSQIWVKDLALNKEHLLTKEIGIYGQASWSPNGSHLAFSEATNCDALQQKSCRSISQIPFALSLQSPQATDVVLQCEQESFGGINWRDNQNLVFISRAAEESRIDELNIETRQIRTIYTDDNNRISALSYSKKFNALAITLDDNANLPSVAILKLDSNEQFQFALNVPEKFKGQPWWDPIWFPKAELLLASAGHSVFEIDMTGNFTEFELPITQDIYNPSFSPDGKSIVASVGIVDTDVVQVPIAAGGNTLVQTPTLIRSTLEDSHAKFAPGGDKLAFVSTRSGQPEVWLSSNDRVAQLSSFKQFTWIRSLVWLPNSSAILLAANNNLYSLTLDGQIRTIYENNQILRMYQMLSEEIILVSLAESQKEQLSTLNIRTGEIQHLYTGAIQWAQATPLGQVVVLDNESRLSRIEKEGLTYFKALKNIEVNSEFVLTNNNIFFVNTNNQLFKFDITTNSLSALEIPEIKTEYLKVTDVNQSQLLFTSVTESRKELVKFSIAR